MGVANGTPKKTKGRPPKGWRRRFLEEFARCGVATFAAKHAGVSTTTLYRAKKADSSFAEAYERAIEESVDCLELEARRRAVDGNDKPVFHNGKKVGSIREYSDTLLIFLLKANRPAKYRDNYGADKAWAAMANGVRGLHFIADADPRYTIPEVDDRPLPDADDPENPPSHAHNGATS